MPTEENQSTNNPVTVALLSEEFILYSQPVVLMANFKGGKRLESAQWSLEIQKMVRGIVQSAIMLENLMNQTSQSKKLRLGDEEIRVSSEELQWIATYLVDNAIFRISACLDKLSQMCRCYFEDSSNGGTLLLPDKKPLTEGNCSFGLLLKCLQADPSRNQDIVSSLKYLSDDEKIKEFKEHRNTFTHRKHTLDNTAGLDPKVSTTLSEDGFSKATLSFGGGSPSFDYLRRGIYEANNAIVKCVEEVGRTIFPRDFKMIRKESSL